MTTPRAQQQDNRQRFTIALAVLTLVVLVVSAPASLREAFERGGFYVFSHDFLVDIPKRLAGPGRFRFILQPLVAIWLGIRSGLADLKEDRPPYLSEMILRPGERSALLRSAFHTVTNVLLMGVLMDSVFQWIILGMSYPGAALVVGPVLICVPYTVARDLSNRVARQRRAVRAR